MDSKTFIGAAFVVAATSFGASFSAPFPAQSGSGSGEGASETSKSAAKASADAAIAPVEAELLDLAFAVADALPVNPHVKDRSRTQEAVITACLELGQPRRALAHVDAIANWRRGTALAACAEWFADHGDAAQAQRLAELARKVADGLSAEDAQEWQRDRIRVGVARTYARLGQAELAAQLEAGVVDAEAGKVDVVRAQLGDATTFDAQIAALDAVAASKNFDRLRGALDACAQLYGRFYDDAARRAHCQERLEAALATMPAPIRVDLFAQLADAALAHGDAATALALVANAGAALASVKLTLDAQAPLFARIAVLRHRAGEESAAHAEVDAALADFARAQATVANIDRAGILRAYAEAYQAMGDADSTLTVYRLAVEAGVENPNSRPRAEDLAATCCSMATHHAPPDAELLARLHAIGAALGAPW